MRAARFYGPGQPLAIEEIERPPPGSGEVLIEVGAAGVCGTELHFLDGLLTPAKTPITFGHEVAGRIAAIGEGGSGLEVGQRVAVHYTHACRRCRRCRAGLEHLCDSPRGFLEFVTDGGFAEYLVVPDTACAPVPDELSLAEAAPLGCSATTALHAANAAELDIGDWAVVYGCGGVGLALVQVLALAGVRVAAVSRSYEKLRLAEELGAETSLDVTATDPTTRIHAATGGDARAVFDFVGTKESAAAAFGSLGKGGALVYVGYSFDRIEINPLDLVVPEVRILTSVGNTYAELVQALDLAARGHLRTHIHETAPLEQANRVFDELRSGRVVGRAVLTP